MCRTFAIRQTHQHQVKRSNSNVIAGLNDRRQGRFCLLGEEIAVATSEHDVLRHTLADGLKGLKKNRGDVGVDGDDRVRTVFACENALRRAGCSVGSAKKSCPSPDKAGLGEAMRRRCRG